MPATIRKQNRRERKEVSRAHSIVASQRAFDKKAGLTLAALSR